MLKYIFFPTTRDVWRDLAVHLYRQDIASPVIWIGHRCHDQFAREEFQSCNVINFNDVNKGVIGKQAFSQRCTGPALKILREPWFSEFKDQTLRMFDRKDYFGAFRMIDREAVFYRLVFSFYSLIEKERPDFLLMAESPHSAATFVVYRICEYLNIPVIGFMSCSVAPALFIKSGIDKPILKLTSQKKQDSFKKSATSAIDQMIINFSPENHKPQQPRYMLNQRRKERGRKFGRPLKMLRDVARALLNPLLPGFMRARTYSAFHGFSAFGNNPGPISEILKFVTEIKSQRMLIQSCTEKSISESEFPSDYAFFPLHYEPERTSNPDGGEWNNQYHALARLRQLLPQDVAIVVKEHPSQLGSVLQGFRGRSRLFYEAISTLENTFFAQVDIPSWKIQQNALFTCTITGTAALEAAISGKPSLLMGHPWFQGCPGITQISESTTIEDIVNNTATKEEVRSFLYRLINEYSIFGVVNPSNERYFSMWFQDGQARSIEAEGIKDFTLLAIDFLVAGKHEKK